jgi:hypothetical protein
MCDIFFQIISNLIMLIIFLFIIFVVYLTMWLVAQTVQFQIVEWLVNNELEQVWRETVIT